MNARFKHIAEDEFEDVAAALREQRYQEEKKRMEERATKIATLAERVTGWEWKGGWDMDSSFTIYSATEGGRSLSLLIPMDPEREISLIAHYETQVRGLRKKVLEKDLPEALLETCELARKHHEQLAKDWATPNGGPE